MAPHLVAHQGIRVRAAVEEDVDGAVHVAGQDDGPVAQRGGDEVTGSGNVLLAAYADPRAGGGGSCRLGGSLARVPRVATHQGRIYASLDPGAAPLEAYLDLPPGDDRAADNSLVR
jgi:hypothetical protein